MHTHTCDVCVKHTVLTFVDFVIKVRNDVNILVQQYPFVELHKRQEKIKFHIQHYRRMLNNATYSTHHSTHTVVAICFDTNSTGMFVSTASAGTFHKH